MKQLKESLEVKGRDTNTVRQQLVEARQVFSNLRDKVAKVRHGLLSGELHGGGWSAVWYGALCCVVLCCMY